MEALPLADDSIDFLVTIGALSCARSVEHAIVEVQRVLRRGGCFAFMEHAVNVSTSSLATRWQSLFDRIACRPVERPLQPLPNFKRAIGAMSLRVQSAGHQLPGVVHGFAFV